MNKIEVDRHQEEHFKKWLQSAETKLLISMVPPTNPPEVLVGLLRAAFEQGFGSGMGLVMVSLLTEVILKDKSR